MEFDVTPPIHAFLRRVIVTGSLQVERSCGSVIAVGDGAGQPIAMRFADRRAEHQLMLNPELALGELFMDGRLAMTRGSVYDLLELIARNLRAMTAPGLAGIRDRVRLALRPLHQHNTVRRAKSNVAHHYDLDGGLYDLFLDADRQYSCAYFEHPGQSLDEAQLAKKRHIAAKLLIEPGQRVLDIGSGWGGLALYLAEHCSADVTGITLSEEQLDMACRRVGRRQLGSHVRFRLQDYRTVTERFDRIVSVGMFEHVGVGYYPTFFRKAADLLTDDGIMLLHSIGRTDGPGATNSWIAKYIFPGGHAPALSEVVPAIERAGLVITDVEILRLHYAETLKAWRERFLARRDEAMALYDERYCRMWEFYLAGCEVGFRYGGLMVFQIQLAKRQDAVPLTRAYVGRCEAELASREIQHAGQRMLAAE
jgi:cyclopropane-fatty-acyl-phospholipid synthase